MSMSLQIISAVIAALVTAILATNTLEYGGVLQNCENITSSSGKFFAIIQEDGNFVVYIKHHHGFNLPCWATGTDGIYGSPNRLELQKDNNLVIINHRDEDVVVWTSETSGKGKPGAKLLMKNNGILVLNDPDGKELWHTRRYLQYKDKRFEGPVRSEDSFGTEPSSSSEERD